jgi:hypothetical protein
LNASNDGLELNRTHQFSEAAIATRILEPPNSKPRSWFVVKMDTPFAGTAIIQRTSIVYLHRWEIRAPNRPEPGCASAVAVLSQSVCCAWNPPIRAGCLYFIPVRQRIIHNSIDESFCQPNHSLRHGVTDNSTKSQNARTETGPSESDKKVKSEAGLNKARPSF